MSGRLVAVHFHGALAERFGARHYFDIRTPAEAVRAMDANHPGFRAAFLATAERYAICADGDWRDGLDGAVLPISREVHFCPRVEGGAFIGAALVGYAIPALAGTLAAEIIGAVLVAALVWGVSQLFASKAAEAVDPAELADSYVFTGPENVAAQGAAVPVVYGRCVVGSVVVSAGLSAGDQIILAQTSLAAGSPTQLAGASLRIEPGMAQPRGGLPPIELQTVGPPDARVRRLGPAGWHHMGAHTLSEADQQRQVDLFVSPDSVAAWDYWRGFRDYRMELEPLP